MNCPRCRESKRKNVRMRPLRKKNKLGETTKEMVGTKVCPKCGYTQTDQKVVRQFHRRELKEQEHETTTGVRIDFSGRPQ